MQELSRDGVAIAQGIGQSSTARGEGPHFTDEVILMPASRVELFISYVDALNLQPETRVTTRGTPCVHPDGIASGPVSAEFVTLGFDTGGDPWPAIELANVILEPPSAPLSSGAGPGMRVALPDQSPEGVAPALDSGAKTTLRQRLTQDLAEQQMRAGQQEPAEPERAATRLGRKTKCGPDAAENDQPFDAPAEAGKIRVIWFGVGLENAVVPPDAPDLDPARAMTKLPAPAGDTFELASELGFAGQGGRQAMSRRRLSTSAESFGTSR
jgi:hypothetical protein